MTLSLGWSSCIITCGILAFSYDITTAKCQRSFWELMAALNYLSDISLIVQILLESVKYSSSPT